LIVTLSHDEEKGVKEFSELAEKEPPAALCYLSRRKN
jgi:hypothetical protein